jgi:hypothetical protein
MEEEIIDPFASRRLSSVSNESRSRIRQFPTRDPSYTIPEVYRQVYRVLRLEHEDDRISKTMINALFHRSRLESDKVEYIWKLVNNNEEEKSLDRADLNTILGLIALAQQGKKIDMDTLLNSKDIPCPKLEDLDSLLVEFIVSTQESTKREKSLMPLPPINNGSLSSTHDDRIHIKIAPEKRGTLFKHTTYLVSSTVGTCEG